MLKDMWRAFDSELNLKAESSLAQKLLNQEPGLNTKTYEPNKYLILAMLKTDVAAIS